MANETQGIQTGEVAVGPSGKRRTHVDDIDRSMYDFRYEDSDAEKLDAGLTPDIVREISERKNEPEWAALPYIDVVEEALCFGWIDSTSKKMPDGRLAQRLSPRRRGSHWTDLNRQRCRDLEARGLMTPAGHAALRAHESMRKAKETNS